MTSEKMYDFINYLILVITPIVICISILVGPDLKIQFLGTPYTLGDYALYYKNDWTALLTGQNPYNYLLLGNPAMCYYPVGYLAFGGLFYLNPLLPKAFFCLTWMLTAYVINRICKNNNVSDEATLTYCVALFLLNPFYIMIVLLAGHYDVTVGLCVLLAVYSIEKSDNIKSGIYASLAFLLKFVGLVLFFPLIITKKKVNWKVGITALVTCGGSYLLGFLLWGPSVFDPFIVQIFRNPEGSSILLFIKEKLGINIAPLIPAALVIAVVIVSIYLYFKNTDIITFSLILIILFMLVLPVFWIHYVLWFFPLLIYWAITHAYKLRWILGFLLVVLVTSLIFYWFVSTIYAPVFVFLGVLVILLFLFLNRKKEKESNP